MGISGGIFLNLQCDCHKVASTVYIDKTDQSVYQFQHSAARFDSAMNKWTHIFSIVRTGLLNYILP